MTCTDVIHPVGPGSKVLAPRILLAATLRWPIAARLAIAFRNRGCEVVAICPGQHPVCRIGASRRAYRHSLLAPLKRLRKVIETVEPDLIVPCDDEAAIHLQQLHVECLAQGEQGRAVCERIVRSLGAPHACLQATARGGLMELAGDEGLDRPLTQVVRTQADLAQWLVIHGFPAVLKLDGTWGGQGVEIVRDQEEARRSFARLASRPPLRGSAVRLLLDRNPSPILEFLRNSPRVVTVQQFIEGRPANRAVACWQGEVLAGISVEVIHTHHANGPATVVRVVDRADMSTAVERLVRRLGVSGLWGADFVVSAASGKAYLVEVNPRATPVCHLPLGPGRDLASALVTKLPGGACATVPPAILHDVIALFPGELQRDPASRYLQLDHHDVPWEESELVRDGLDRPWSERGLLARARALLRRRGAPAG